jgi:hypothetical protein
MIVCGSGELLTRLTASFSQPVSFSAGSFSFFRKSASDNDAASQFRMASSGTISTGVFHDVEVSL